MSVRWKQLRLRNPSILLALATILLMCGDHFKLSLTRIPKSFCVEQNLESSLEVEQAFSFVKI